jgi:hypothetical protein
MRAAFLLVAIMLLSLNITSQVDSSEPLFEIRKPTVLAFFTPVSSDGADDSDTDEACRILRSMLIGL